MISAMNTVHAVLRNWDILQVIMTFVKDEFSWPSQRRDIFTLALVSRVFSNLALDFLWRNVDLKNVDSLFPMDMIRVHPRGKKSLIFPATTPQHWERFDVYASRIRQLSASPLQNDLFLLSARTRYPTLHHPFPNLTCLRWSSTPSKAVDAITLMSPTLTEVRVSIDVDDYEEDEQDNVVADAFRVLGDRCPRLRKFEYIHYSGISPRRSKTVETSLIYLIHQCRRLEEVQLPVSRDILRALGSLPHLSALLLEHVTWVDGSQFSLPVQTDEWLEEADSFPVLDDLHIEGSHTVSSLTECFRGSGCFPRTSFTMWEMSQCEQWSTPAMAEFLRGILRQDRSEGSLSFCLDRGTAVRNHVGHDPWQALRFLSSIPNLRQLWIEGFFLDITDADLEEMTRTWPDLCSLRLNVPSPSPRVKDYRSQITFEGLAHLSTLENLERLSLMLAPESTISESMLSSSTLSNSRVKYLTIQGKFPPVTTYAATKFLLLHFPKLKSIHSSVSRDKEEEGRMKEIQFMLDGLQPTMKEWRSMCRRLRWLQYITSTQDGGED